MLQEKVSSTKLEITPIHKLTNAKLATRLLEIQKGLLEQFSGNSKAPDSWDNCEKFFLAHLEARIAQIWLSTIAKVIKCPNATTPTNDLAARQIVYKILVVVAKSLSEDVECTLAGIVEKLQSSSLIKEDIDDNKKLQSSGLIKEDSEENLALQMVFQFVGWLTALFDPSPTPSPASLELCKAGHISRRRRLVRQRVIRQSSIPVSEARQPVHRLLRRFGSLLPEVLCVRRSEMAGGPEAGPECIIASYVSFHSIEQVLNVSLEWVSTLNQHLEFDQSQRILRVFRLPSLCRLMYRDAEGMLLSGLFNENHREDAGGSVRPAHHTFKANIEDFLVEVMLSYRLIFGRKRRSRSHIARKLAREKERYPEDGHNDPLLDILCTHTSESPDIKKLYEDLEAEEFDDYVSVDEFPFLARRLLELQQYGMSQNPHSLRRLWKDKRNVTGWFTTWAVIIIGGGTLLFQVLQLVFQIYQPFAGVSSR